MSTDLDQTILDISASIEDLKNRMKSMDKHTKARAERTCKHLSSRILELHAERPNRRGRRIRPGFQSCN